MPIASTLRSLSGADKRAAPVIGSDGTIYLGSYDYTSLYAVNPTTGGVYWYYGAPATFTSAAAVGNDGFVYALSSDGTLVKLSAADGTVSWRFKAGPIYPGSSPVINPAGTQIIVGEIAGKLTAVDPHNGRQLWQFSIPQNSIFTPVVGPDGTVFFCSETVVTAVSSTGSKLWQDTANGCWSAMLLSPSNILFVASATVVRAYGALSGTILWTSQSTGLASFTALALSSDNLLFGITVNAYDRGNLYAWDARSFSLVYSVTRGAGFGDSIVATSAGTVLIAGPAFLSALNASTGDSLYEWSGDLSAGYEAIPYRIAVGPGDRVYTIMERSLYVVTLGFACPSGYFCVTSGSALIQIPCPCGYICPQNSMYPIACDAGTYCSFGASVPMVCPAGSYCTRACCAPIPCPSTTRCPEGTSLPQTCPAGATCNGGAVVSTCPEDSFCLPFSDPHQCHDYEFCPAGSALPRMPRPYVPPPPKVPPTLTKAEIIMIAVSSFSCVASVICAAVGIISYHKTRMASKHHDGIGAPTSPLLSEEFVASQEHAMLPVRAEEEAAGAIQ